MRINLARKGFAWCLIGLLAVLFLIVGPRALRGTLASLLAVAMGLDAPATPRTRSFGLWGGSPSWARAQA